MAAKKNRVLPEAPLLLPYIAVSETAAVPAATFLRVDAWFQCLLWWFYETTLTLRRHLSTRAREAACLSNAHIYPTSQAARPVCRLLF